MKKKSTPTPEYDSGRETRVVLERMEQSIKTVAEQHGSIIKKLEEHDRRFDMLETAITEVDGKVKEIDGKVKEIDGKVIGIDTRLKRVEEKLDAVTSDHESRLQKLEALR